MLLPDHTILNSCHTQIDITLYLTLIRFFLAFITILITHLFTVYLPYPKGPCLFFKTAVTTIPRTLPGPQKLVKSHFCIIDFYGLGVETDINQKVRARNTKLQLMCIL